MWVGIVLIIITCVGIEWLHTSLEKQGIFYDAEHDTWFSDRWG